MGDFTHFTAHTQNQLCSSSIFAACTQTLSVDLRLTFISMYVLKAERIASICHAFHSRNHLRFISVVN